MSLAPHKKTAYVALSSIAVPVHQQTGTYLTLQEVFFLVSSNQEVNTKYLSQPSTFFQLLQSHACGNAESSKSDPSSLELSSALLLVAMVIIT